MRLAVHAGSPPGLLRVDGRRGGRIEDGAHDGESCRLVFGHVHVQQETLGGGFTCGIRVRRSAKLGAISFVRLHGTHGSQPLYFEHLSSFVSQRRTVPSARCGALDLHVLLLGAERTDRLVTTACRVCI